MKNWPREYRYVIAIGAIIIIVFCLAIVAECYKETNTVAEWSFTFFTEWALVLSAAATLLLAGTAFWAIMDNRHARRVEKKERLLNEIIEWAMDLKEPLYSTDVLGKDQKTLYAITHLRIVNVNAKRKKIETIAQEEFRDDLFEYVDKVESSVARYLAAVEFAAGMDEKFILIDEKEKTEIRNKVEQARTKGQKEITDALSEYEKPLIISTTNLIERCSKLITEL